MLFRSNAITVLTTQAEVDQRWCVCQALYDGIAKTRVADVFDYENPDHITKLEDRILGVFSDDSSEFEMIGDVKVGNWQQLEEPNIQDALKKLGFSGYRTNEAGTIGLFNSDKGDVRSLYAKFDPKQEKSGEILATVTPLVTTGTIGALGALSGLEEGT